MLRGGISNKPMAITAIDWRILIEPKYYVRGLQSLIPQLYLESGMEERLRKCFPWRKGAKAWLDRNYECRFCVVILGVSQPIAEAIRIIVEEKVAEIQFFDSREDLRGWLRESLETRFYTEDSSLLGLDESTFRFGGWGQRV